MQKVRRSTLFRCLIKCIFGCTVCSSNLFADIAEDQNRIEQICDLRSCLDTLQTIMCEKVEAADPLALERSLHAYSDVFSSIKFREQNPTDLITASWILFPKFSKAYSLLSNSQISSDEHFTKYGFQQGVIEEELNVKLIEAFRYAKAIPFFEEDCDPNYFASLLGIRVEKILNKDHTYLMLEDQQKAILEPILLSLKKQVSDCLGSAWRVLTIRGWKSPDTILNFGPNGWHSDGMPTGIYKIMYYPYGASEEKGGCELKLSTGVHRLVGPPGTWLLFKNSTIVHRGITSQVGERLAIEITLSPFLENDLRPISAGQNAVYPLLPWQQLYSSGHRLYQKGEVIGVNISGGSNWHCPGWVNLEEVTSSSNLASFRLFPNCRFPFVDESIETVYTSYAMERLNLATAYRVLSESHRILAEEGNLIIKIPDYDKALDCWRRQDYSFFGPEWGIGSITHTWRKVGLYDCLDYRAAMIFCSFFNNAFRNPVAVAGASSSSHPYFGPMIVDIDFFTDLIQNSTPSEIAQVLRLAIAEKESDYHFCHQSAWSRAELKELLSEYGFEVITFDPHRINATFGDIPGMLEMLDRSMYCWARKKTASWN